jgi:two-component system OmpR family sensor kinase
MSEAQDSWLDNIRTVAHELKNPIGAAKGFIELTQAVGPLDEAQAQFLDKALQSIARTEHLVTLMLQAAWVDSGQRLHISDVDLASVIQREVMLLEPMAHQLQVQMHVDVASDIGLIQGDVERLGQVFSNLLSNAVKYNWHDASGQVWLQVRSLGDKIEIDVRDNGVGIPEGDIEHIFERFFRVRDRKRKIEGSGLGLYIVYSLVRMHGGEIKVESTVGEGTRFHVVLPRHLNNTTS